MIRLEDDCVGCPTEMGCLGNCCPYKNVPVFVCDNCESEDEEELFVYNGQQLCFKCLLDNFEQVSDEVYLIDGEEVDVDDIIDKVCEKVINQENYDCEL